MPSPPDADPSAATDVPPDADTGGPLEPVDRDRALINEARARGTGPLFGAFVKLSGPGWLQSAITLGGGSLAGSLYLGVLGGYDFLWLQPIAMGLGIVMLSAISYVTLSTGRRPFEAIKNDINPVLAWAWAVATLLANCVWCLPQFALGTAALQQNLGVSTGDGGKLTCVALILVLAGIVSWFYESGGKGIKLFEVILKVLVGLVVISFMAVTISLLVNGGIDVGQLLSGVIPDFSLASRPSDGYDALLSAAGDSADSWRQIIVSDQRKVMITAFATAVGINMTFLLPYSMLARKWDRDFRGLAIFDLATGLLIPFVLATSCVMIAAASQFHARADEALVADTTPGATLAAMKEAGDSNASLAGGYVKAVDAALGRAGVEAGPDGYTDEDRAALPEADRRLAASLAKKDAFDLARSLQGLLGETVAQKVFGVGVLGMAVSTVIILMLINGFVVCEMLNVPGNATVHRCGAFFAGLVGATGPFVWTGAAKVWLAVPTSMFGAVLLPIAYVTFFCMMNSKKLLGDALPSGGRRLLWNGLMLVAVGVSLVAGGISLAESDKDAKYVGLTILGVVLVGAVAAHFAKKPADAGPSDLAS